MDTISIPCPTESCEGTVTAVAEPVAGGTEWQIEHRDDGPAVSCSQGCRSPEDLEGPVTGALQAG